jgi:type I restriction enzyme S subunit
MIRELKPYPAMRKSGIPWLGELPAHWRTERGKWLFRKMDRPVRDADDVVTCFRDGTVTLRKNRRVRGFTEALKEIGYQGIRRGDLIIHAMDAFAGAVGVSDSDGKGTPVYSVCEPHPDADAHYYAYAIREMARSQWIQALAKGIRERSTDFRFEDFGSQSMPLPPRTEQRAIVRCLDYADRWIQRYIRGKQKLIKLLEEQKQAIIHSTVTRGLDSNARLKPSGLEWIADIPEHWELWQIGHFATVGNGSTPSRSNAAYWSGGNFPWLNSGSVNASTIMASTQFVTDDALRECHLPLVPPGSVLVAITGQGKTRGTAAVLAIEATINQHIAFITPRPVGGAVSPEYLQNFLVAAYSELRRMSDDAGSTKGALTCEDIRHFRVALPPLHEQQRIVRWAASATAESESALRAATSHVSLLHEYRARLMADVVTGKLDVRKAAAQLPDEIEDAEPLDNADAPEESAESPDEGDAILEELEA